MFLKSVWCEFYAQFQSLHLIEMHENDLKMNVNSHALYDAGNIPELFICSRIKVWRCCGHVGGFGPI